MNKDSNNLYAKSLFMSLGAYKTTNQTTYDDARKQYISIFQRKFNFSELANVENGAGLSRTEKISTAHMTQLLGAIYQSPENNYFISTLATPGESGTLQSEFPQFKRKLFAKTGSLSDVKAYSGYFIAANGHIYLISFIANDINATENTTSQLQAFKQLVTAALNQLDTPQ
jgi:D-alanyl-D-alanine carboxypeptidase/D-alanyl-D-alanine-endopeptidase (penicillin-binding protein 4)